uniref:Uncharacterized protein n=1 Tax=Elaeophora elaphi TaxID=1147741 RepID=A0A0R3RN32_9BILA
MDPLQQRFLAQILQQPEQKTLELKGYPEHMQYQILNSETMASNFWSSLLTMQRNGTTYPNFMQNLNTPTIPSSAAPTSVRQSIFSRGFNSIINTNYLPSVPPSTMPPPPPPPPSSSSSLNLPSSIKETQFDELTSLLIVDELRKRAHSTKQTWQNLIRNQQMQLPRLTTQHGLHQQMPSVSPFMKRRMSESLPEQQQQQQTVIKRAKVIVIEQKDPQSSESTLCCSSSPFFFPLFVKYSIHHF